MVLVIGRDFAPQGRRVEGLEAKAVVSLLRQPDRGGANARAPVTSLRQVMEECGSYETCMVPVTTLAPSCGHR
jgi:hypothetical protein